MKSMTGYGKGEIFKDGRELTVEIKSVNNRYLDLNLKYPRNFISLDDVIRKTISSKISRGRLEVFITYKDRREKARNVEVDLMLASGYVSAYTILKANFSQMQDDFTLSRLVQIPDILKTDSSEDDLTEICEILIEAINLSLDGLEKMRSVEGEKLVEDIENRTYNIENSVKEIEKRAPLLIAQYGEKIKTRVSQILENVEFDENRLLTEVAFFVDKSNIDEEITRLYSHIEQFRKSLKITGSGKKLDFLLQEFNREANTICSKANDSYITNLGLTLKCEIEKIREQVQNLE